MAILADVRRLDVGRRPAGCRLTVVAACTIARHRGVIKSTSGPTVVGVAIVASIAALDVVG